MGTSRNGDGWCGQHMPRSTGSAGKVVFARVARGFSLIELVVVVIIIGLLMAFFLNEKSGVWVYQEEAEKAAMVEVAGAVQTALLLQYGHLLAIGKGEPEVVALASENPMGLMARVPENYAGEFYDPLPNAIVPGKWIFDLKARELVYVPRLTNNLEPGSDGNRWIRYRAKLVYDPASGRPGKGVIESILFEPVEPYHWLEKI